MPWQIRAIGRVEAVSTVNIRPLVDGALLKVDFREGQWVNKHDLLFEIDRRPLEAALKLSEANHDRDAARAAYAESEAQRIEGLYAKNVANVRERDQARSEADALKATVDADAAMIDRAKVDLEYCTIRAPLSGRAGDLMVHPGSVMKAKDTDMVRIHQMRPIYVAFSVAEQYLPRIRKQQAREPLVVLASLTPDGPNPSRGVLSVISNEVDPTAGTIRLKATFPNADDALWPGQFVNILLLLGQEENAVVVPSVAVKAGQKGSYVFVIRPDHTVTLVWVGVDRTIGDWSVVTSGLKAGDTVVTEGQLRLVPGSLVEVLPKNAAAGKAGT